MKVSVGRHILPKKYFLVVGIILVVCGLANHGIEVVLN